MWEWFLEYDEEIEILDSKKSYKKISATFFLQF